MIQYFCLIGYHLRMYLKTVPVGAGAVFMFDRYLDIAYNVLNKGTES
ncbi:hypothetical protein [Parablautia intestinalis]|nr:hypothetical protein [Parablautia intestinalis]